MIIKYIHTYHILYIHTYVILNIYLIEIYEIFVPLKDLAALVWTQPSNNGQIFSKIKSEERIVT